VKLTTNHDIRKFNRFGTEESDKQFISAAQGVALKLLISVT
jgi:hypothetical protein